MRSSAAALKEEGKQVAEAEAVTTAQQQKRTLGIE
jgi:hypothetical protein